MKNDIEKLEELYEAISYKENSAFEDMFGKRDKPSKVIKVDPPAKKEITLDLYRGFDADIDSLEKQGDAYILSPHKSEQGAIWFSQWLRDAKGRGEWILKYQLKAIKHYQRKHTDDGSYFDDIPQEILDKETPMENSNIWRYRTS